MMFIHIRTSNLYYVEKRFYPGAVIYLMLKNDVCADQVSNSESKIVSV